MQCKWDKLICTKSIDKSTLAIADCHQREWIADAGSALSLLVELHAGVADRSDEVRGDDHVE